MIPTLQEWIAKNLIYAFIVCFTIMIAIGPIIMTEFLPQSAWCPDTADDPYYSNTSVVTKIYENPDHEDDPCLYMRLPLLLYLTMEEADCCRRMLASVLMGYAIGYERRASDRAAGVRTMGLVSLGSCIFTITSQLAFKGSTMGWDASRVTAAVPSGVGFLGAGLIWKGTVKEEGQGRGQGPGAKKFKFERHEVHGLTTAAGVWLSAGIGVGCGGRLYFVSAYTTVLVTMILKYGPMLYLGVTRDTSGSGGTGMDMGTVREGKGTHTSSRGNRNGGGSSVQENGNGDSDISESGSYSDGSSLLSEMSESQAQPQPQKVGRAPILSKSATNQALEKVKNSLPRTLAVVNSSTTTDSGISRSNSTPRLHKGKKDGHHVAFIDKHEYEMYEAWKKRNSIMARES